jgi:hypothetical protein
VSYNVEVDPGPAYHMGFVRFENVSGEAHQILMKLWRLPPGDPFDGAYVDSFLMKAEREDRLLRQELAGLLAKVEIDPDPASLDVNVIIRFEK